MYVSIGVNTKLASLKGFVTNFSTPHSRFRYAIEMCATVGGATGDRMYLAHITPYIERHFTLNLIKTSIH